ILITPLFHYGFVLAVPIALIFKFIGKFLYSDKSASIVLLYVFYISLILSFALVTNSIILGFFTQTDALSGAVGNRLNYVNSNNVADIVASKQEDSLFLTVQSYFNYGIKVFIFFTVLLVRRSLKNISHNKLDDNKLFAFVLFFYSFAF